jgi:ATP-dependent Clp protease adapter protein ClpS
MSSISNTPDQCTATRKKLKLTRPPKYCNVFYNNDVTPFDIVIALLIKAFKYTAQDAEQKAKEIHERDKGIIHINSKEVCELKHEVVKSYMNQLNEINLKTTIELYEEEND